MELNKFHYYDGLYYEHFIEPRFREIREIVAVEVPSGSTVLDIGCGTGALAFDLSQKDIQTTGIDLSQRMIKHALQRQAKIGDKNVRFLHGDAAQLGEGTYNYAVISMALHEMSPEQRLAVVGRAKELGDRVILADYASPLPLNLAGARVRLGEFFSGIDHFKSFLNYQATDGLDTILDRSGLKVLNDTTNPRGTLRVVVTE